MKYNKHEVRHIVNIGDGHFMIRYIDEDKGTEFDKCEYMSELDALGIKRITATHSKFNAYCITYKKLIIEFKKDGRRYITVFNTDAEWRHIIHYFRKMIVMWEQCITVLKCIESKSVTNVKQFVDDMGYKELINNPFDAYMSRNMKSKVNYIRYLYNS